MNSTDRTTNTAYPEARDIQALLRSGFAKLRHADYLLLAVHRRADALGWLQQLVDSGLVLSAAAINRGQQVDAVAAVAFSASGLEALGLPTRPEWPLPSAFAAGMGSARRAEVLREPAGAPPWAWSDIATPARPAAHMLLMLFSGDGRWPARLQQPCGFGWSQVARVRGCPAYLQTDRGDKQAKVQEATKVDGATKVYEPFGFRDGSSQPDIRELRDPDAAASQRGEEDAPASDHRVAAGEFVLGHRNQYGEVAYCPDVEGWADFARDHDLPARPFAFNGSYLAVRQIAQDAAGFIAAHHTPRDGPTDAELMVGRRRGAAGSPLQKIPHTPSDVNAFRFRVDDLDGFQCPRGAHIRRANPRDLLGADRAAGLRMSKLHRLLRRGRPYTDRAQCCDPACGHDERRWLACDYAAQGQQPAAAACGAGLFFIACNADLERQFEFVQQRWLANAGFGDLQDEVDPVAGAPVAGRFTVPGLPHGRVVQGIRNFLTTVGGGYFFLPGLAALRFVASSSRLGPQPAPAPAAMQHPA